MATKLLLCGQKLQQLTKHQGNGSELPKQGDLRENMFHKTLWSMILLLKLEC